MAVGILVGDTFYYEIGTGDFVHSFFSTIAHNLEPKGWGTKFPILMRNLYNNQVDYKDIAGIKKELKEIENKLSKLKPDRVVWDIEDLSKLPPWGDNYSNKIKNLANYFATSEGKTFFEIFENAIQMAETGKYSFRVRKI